MARLPIHLLGSPILRQRSEEITAVDAELRKFVDDLFETMRAAQGIGLAANQVGVTRRVAVVETEGHPPIVLINPIIRERQGTSRAEEGCLSIPEIFGDVDRAAQIVLETTELDATRRTYELEDLTARAVQHEIDHLDGILFLDHLSPLKRRMLQAKWKKQRKGQKGYIQPVPAKDPAR